MIEAIRLYEIYTAVNLHFNSTSYDYFKYSGTVKNVSEKSFLAAKGKFFFQKLAKNFNDETEALGFCVANFIAGKKWINSYDMPTYRAWVEKWNRLDYTFYEDMSSYLRKKKENTLIELVHSEQLSKEFLVLLNKLSEGELYKTLDKKEDFVWKESSKVIKRYEPFLLYLWNIDNETLQKLNTAVKKAKSSVLVA